MRSVRDMTPPWAPAPKHGAECIDVERRLVAASLAPNLASPAFRKLTRAEWGAVPRGAFIITHANRNLDCIAQALNSSSPEYSPSAVAGSLAPAHAASRPILQARFLFLPAARESSWERFLHACRCQPKYRDVFFEAVANGKRLINMQSQRKTSSRSSIYLAQRRPCKCIRISHC